MHASAPDVPFCATTMVATTVVLARCSAPERVRSATPAGSAAERCSVCSATGTHGLRTRDHRCTCVSTHPL